MISRKLLAIETQRRVIQSRLDARRTAVDRNRLGQFATPNDLAIEIAQYVQSLLDDRTGPVRFADPSIGTGSFFSAALAVFGDNRIKTSVGVELDAAFCAAACELWGASGLEVVCDDFTRFIGDSGESSRPNLILANPPYVRHHHLEVEDKKRLQRLVEERTGVEINGLAGLYVYFLLLATAWLEDDGFAAWLIPSEFMDVNYGTAVKRFLCEQVTLIRVHRFDPDDLQFGDAFVSSAVIVFRKVNPPADHMIEFTFGGTIAEPAASEAIPLHQLRESRKWTTHPRSASNDRRVSEDHNGPTLSDFFRIQRGIATGCNKFFVLKRSDAISQGLPSRYLRPILPSPRNLKTTIIESNSDGYPRLEQQLCVIDCDLPESIVEAKHPKLWNYLQTAAALGIMDGYLVGKRAPWYKQERREPAPFLCTYMGRGANDKRPFRFICNRSNAIGTNLYLMLYPQKGLAEMLRLHPERADDVHSLLGDVTGNELRGEGRVYGGGLHKIEPSELGRVSATAMVEKWPELAENLKRAMIPSLFV